MSAAQLTRRRTLTVKGCQMDPVADLSSLLRFNGTDAPLLRALRELEDGVVKAPPSQRDEGALSILAMTGREWSRKLESQVPYLDQLEQRIDPWPLILSWRNPSPSLRNSS